MSQYITTTNSEGKGVLSEKVPTARHAIEIPGGSMEILYTSHSAKPNLSTEADIEQYAHDRTNGLPNNAIAPEVGTSGAIITFKPDAVSLFHRTMTIDTIVVIQGDLEHHGDSGEVQTLHAGDSIIQRGTMHQWKNVTPNGGVAKMACFAQSIVAPLEVSGKKLDTEWVF